MLLLILLFITISISCFAISQKLRKKITKKGIKQIRPISNGMNSREPLIGGEVTLSDGTRLKLTEMEITEVNFFKINVWRKEALKGFLQCHLRCPSKSPNIFRNPPQSH